MHRSLCAFLGLSRCGGDDAGSSSPPPPANDWSSAGIVWADPSGEARENPAPYRKIGTIVHLKGMADAGEVRVRSGQFAGTLPVGCRPPGPRLLLCPTWGWPAGPLEEGYIGAASPVVFPDGRPMIWSLQQYVFFAKGFSTR